MDQDAERIMRMLDFPGLNIFTLGEIETPELLAVKSERSETEYAQTMKTASLQYVFSKVAEGDWIVLVDADMMFFGDLASELPVKDASVLVCPHNYTPLFKKFEKLVGYINGGIVGFRKDAHGAATLDWWQESCLAWCSLIQEEHRYGDQKYMSEFHTRFKGVVEIQNLGIDTAPWNAIERQISVRDKRVFIEDFPLVAYHFQGLRQITDSVFNIYADETIRIPDPLRRLVYAPYIAAMHKVTGDIIEMYPDAQEYLEGIHPRFVVQELKKWVLGKSNLMVASQYT